MGSQRFFLADLPARTTEKDLKQLFQDYGHIEGVELKTKEQYSDTGEAITKTIGFVTLQHVDDPHYCVNELNWQKLHGSKLRVSLAKESFLDRLKRERTETQQNDAEDNNSSQFTQSDSNLFQNTQNKRRVFGENEEYNDDDIAPELLITKKRASTSWHNGKIVVQKDHDVAPLHIIERHKKPAKQQLDAKSAAADQKRKQSLHNMKNAYDQKKTAIQQALSSNATNQAKRIKFSDSEDGDEDDKKEKKSMAKNTRKSALFDGDSNDEEENIILPQYGSKKGERLLELQSKNTSIDPRFRITANFVDGEENDDDNDDGDGDDKESKEFDNNDDDDAVPQDNERAWQLGILEQVVGHKVDSSNANDVKAKKTKKMLRFDPANEEHQKLVRQPGQQQVESQVKQAKKQTKGKQSKQETVETEIKTDPVTKTAFYVVTDTLKESLNMRGDGFSLLDMFGSSGHDEVEAQRQQQLKEIENEKIIVNKPSKLPLSAINPFSYESSDSEDDVAVKENQKEISTAETAKRKTKSNKIFGETFFIPKNDVRLKEGAKFFKFDKKPDNVNYEKVRNRLKMIITKKIVKTKRNKPGGGDGGVAKKNRNKKTK